LTEAPESVFRTSVRCEACKATTTPAEFRTDARIKSTVMIASWRTESRHARRLDHHGFNQIVGAGMESYGGAPGTRRPSSRCNRLALPGYRSPSNRGSTRNSPSKKKSITDTVKRATSRTEGSRTSRRFFPTAFATRSAASSARTDGWILARARARPYSTITHPKTIPHLLKSAAGPDPRRTRSRFPSRIAGRTNGDNRRRASATIACAISPVSACGNIRSRSSANSSSSLMCTAASLTRKICPDSSRRC
jgi:hypothetical protein